MRNKYYKSVGLIIFWSFLLAAGVVKSISSKAAQSIKKVSSLVFLSHQTFDADFAQTSQNP